jgi:hypothetical protein
VNSRLKGFTVKKRLWVLWGWIGAFDIDVRTERGLGYNMSHLKT